MDEYCTCLVCGKFFAKSNAVKNSEYCSKECEELYVRCSICGEYYIIDEMLDPKNQICSRECAKRFKFKKKTENYKFDFTSL